MGNKLATVLTDCRNWTTQRQTKAFQNIAYELYFWNRGESPFLDRPKGDRLFGESLAIVVAQWKRGRNSTAKASDAFQVRWDQDHYNEWRHKLTRKHPSNEIIDGTTSWEYEIIPTQALEDDNACFLVVSNVIFSENAKRNLQGYRSTNGTQIIRQVKKMLLRYQKQNQVDLRMKNLQVACVDGVNRHRKTLVFWFRKN
tara:strand:+ start:10398 stop:10994 length:597 start_codon:yes stop_codon:yes gene_type:complete